MRLTALTFARVLLAPLALGASLAFALPFSADYRVSTVAGSSQSPRIVGEPGTNNLDRKSTRLNSSHIQKSRMPSSA